MTRRLLTVDAICIIFDRTVVILAQVTVIMEDQREYLTYNSLVRFQVLTAANMKFRFVFWDVLPCKIIVDRRFRGTCCLHHQGYARRQI
jgi:hypothetical protein